MRLVAHFVRCILMTVKSKIVSVSWSGWNNVTVVVIDLMVEKNKITNKMQRTSISVSAFFLVSADVSGNGAQMHFQSSILSKIEKR